LNNQFKFDSHQARDAQLLGLGTVVKTNDVGDSKALYQINLGNTLINLMPITQVKDKTALETLPEQINMAINGDIVQVEDAGNGQTARFIYVNYEFASKDWRRIDENNRVILAHRDASLNPVYYVTLPPPYADGTLIHVEDAGNGKAVDYVYAVTNYTDGPNVGSSLGEAYEVTYYQVTDMTALQKLTDSTNIFTGVQVDVAQAQNGQLARFVFDGNDWVHYGNVLEVPDISAQKSLKIAKSGHIAHLPTGSTIYTGNEWIDLGTIYRVKNLAERDVLNVKHGDLVKVADVGDGHGHFDSFLYVDGEWIKQIRGGHAGIITINADNIQLTNNSEISTESISGGGGHLTLNVDKMVFINNSEVSTSVEQSVGDGGNLSIQEPQFIINGGKIVARAYEGHGGNIHLESQNFIASSDSIVSASSKLGVSGHVEIESPNVDVSSGLFIFSGDFIDASTLLDTHCKKQLTEMIDLKREYKPNSFVVHRSSGSVSSPDDFQGSTVLPISVDNNQSSANRGKGRAVVKITCPKKHN